MCKIRKIQSTSFPFKFKLIPIQIISDFKNGLFLLFTAIWKVFPHVILSTRELQQNVKLRMSRTWFQMELLPIIYLVLGDFSRKPRKTFPIDFFIFFVVNKFHIMGHGETKPEWWRWCCYYKALFLYGFIYGTWENTE